jgi:hypothetical protein
MLSPLLHISRSNDYEYHADIYLPKHSHVEQFPRAIGFSTLETPDGL